LELRRKIHDGDVIAFVGDSLTDNVIKLFGSKYGHVAIVCNSMLPEEHECQHDGDVLMFESFSSHHGKPVVDALSGKAT